MPPPCLSGWRYVRLKRGLIVSYLPLLFLFPVLSYRKRAAKYFLCEDATTTQVLRVRHLLNGNTIRLSSEMVFMQAIFRKFLSLDDGLLAIMIVFFCYLGYIHFISRYCQLIRNIYIYAPNDLVSPGGKGGRNQLWYLQPIFLPACLGWG